MKNWLKLSFVALFSSAVGVISAQQEIKPVEVKAAIERPNSANQNNTAVYQPNKKGGMDLQQEQVHTVVDKQAEFPGGQVEIDKYFQGANESTISATPAKTYVSFTVEKDGTIKDVVLVRSTLSSAKTDRIIKQVKNMPAWKPALIMDEPVRSRVTLAIPNTK